jgi:uncharacterized protein involved in exopolysaccharide biosynthesis
MTNMLPVARDTEPSFLDVANLVLRRWKFLTYASVIGALTFLAASFLAPPMYVAHTALIQAEPSRTSLPASLGALASRFGVGLGATGATASLDFVEQVVTTRDVLDSVLLHRLAVDRSQTFNPSIEPRDTIDLISWFHIHDDTEAKRLDHLRRLVLKRMNVSSDQRSGIVRLSIELRDPYVAAAFLRTVVEALNAFNLHTRQTTSHANRIFLEQRVTESKAQLNDAEDRLRTFYEQNRRITDAPALVFEEGRLKRQVDLEQQIFVTLSQDLEQARIEEIKDTPVLTVIETAQPPVRRSSPKRALLTLMGAFVGIVIGFLSLVLRTYLQRAAQTNSAAWREFQHHLLGIPGGHHITRLPRRSDGDSHR